MAILDADGNEIVKPLTGKEYLFAIDGQIYDAAGISTFDAISDVEMRQDLVNQTTLQAAFIDSLKGIMEYWHSKEGIHPNIKKMTIWNKEDEDRLKCLIRTVKWFGKQDPPVEHEEKYDDLKFRAMNKMFESIEEMPDAWTKEGQLKPEQMKEYMEGMKKAQMDLNSSPIDLSNL